jgi:dihydropteroate synthase
MKPRKPYTLAWQDRRLELGHRTAVMAVLNVTPDSFSDGGRFYAEEKAVDQGRKLASEGADILDVGGESTRPFSDPVSEKEEIRRVVPVIRRLAAEVPVPISIDTTKAAVAREALGAGATMINDVGALRLDPELARVAAERGVPVILMHMLGTPKTMQVSPDYGDVLGEIGQFLEEAVHRAVGAGIARERVVVDPGIGFGKTVEHNLRILAGLDRLAGLGYPILVGVSRKAFIRKILGRKTGSEPAPDAPETAWGTQAAVAAAVMAGAHIVRVHDVAETRATAALVDALRAAAGGDSGKSAASNNTPT